MVDSFTVLLPSHYRARLNEIAVVQCVFLNWLDIKLDEKAEEKMPILTNMKGWRNREIFAFVCGPNSWDWTARMYQ